MLRAVFNAIVLSALVLSMSGCAVIGTAISAAIGYGIYKAIKH